MHTHRGCISHLSLQPAGDNTKTSKFEFICVLCCFQQNVQVISCIGSFKGRRNLYRLVGQDSAM